jgi:hypothetical protein
VEQRVVWEQGWKQVLRDIKIRSGFFHMTDFEAAPKCNDPNDEYAHLRAQEIHHFM